ncbi:MAG: BatA domain-containing protein [Gemmataceae bacterium]
MATFLTALSGLFYLPWMLTGLAVLSIPLLIHLLNRRRFDVVEWGAMQFLQLSEVTRRRLLLEEILLMLLRMGLLALLVLALAGPFLDLPSTGFLQAGKSRDVVYLLDRSASMASIDNFSEQSADSKAKEWIEQHIKSLGGEDQIAILNVRDHTRGLMETLSSDRARVNEVLEKSRLNDGTARWPEALQKAHSILEKSHKSLKEIILLGDNQKFGLADSETLFRWELMKEKQATTSIVGSDAKHRLWYVNLAQERDGSIPNMGLGNISCSRPVAAVDREVQFRCELLLSGQESYAPPYRIRLEVDGKVVRDLPPPPIAKDNQNLGREGKIPLSFSHRFSKPGNHLVSLILEPDPPRDARPPGYKIKDQIPGDNRQDFALEVVTALPVLLVSENGSTEKGTSIFIRDALAPARDRNPSVQIRSIKLAELNGDSLQSENPPRVVILHDLSSLKQSQVDALTSYLNQGGGLLITLGSHVSAVDYNRDLWKNGEGWLPARIDEIKGTEGQKGQSARPDPESFLHPVLNLFAKETSGGFGDCWFSRWWSLSTPGRNVNSFPVGQLQSPSGKYPFMMERDLPQGRVLLCAVPLDNTWQSNIVDLPAFVPLLHETVYYLAGTRVSEFNLKPGQPIRYRFAAESIDGFRITTPEGKDFPLSTQPGDPDSLFVQVNKREDVWQLVYEGTFDPGIYRLHTPSQEVVYFVVPSDPRESNLTPCSSDDQNRVQELTGVQFAQDSESILNGSQSPNFRQDLWPYFLLALLGFLCMEVWATRRMVMNR